MAEATDHKDYILTIDFGTSKCRFSVLPLGGKDTIPSCAVFLPADDESPYDEWFAGHAGQDFIERGKVDPSNVFTDIKRLLGLKITDPSVTVQKNYSSFNVAEGLILNCGFYILPHILILNFKCI